MSSDDQYLYFVRTPETIAVNNEYDGRRVNTVYAYDDFKVVHSGDDWTWAWSGNTLIRHVVFEPSFRNVHLPTLEGFLQGDPKVERFLEAAEMLVGDSITKYLERKFTSLSVSFGCTGGQHRSVFCAERMAKWIAENFQCHVVINHREQQ